VIRPLSKAFDEMLRVPQRIGWILAAAIVLLGNALSPHGPFDVPFLVASLVALLIASWLPVAILPASDRALVSLFVFTLRDQDKRWIRLSPEEPIPRGESEPRRWMARHPVDLADRDSVSFHGGLLMRLGDYAAAEDLTRLMPVETPAQRFDQVVCFAQIDFERGGDGDLAESRRLLAEIPEGPDLERAVRDYAFEETQRQSAVGGDWRAPLSAIHSPHSSSGIGSVATLGLMRLAWVLPRFVIGWVLVIVVFGIATSNVDVG
jgi:hypothetical protein